MGMMAANQELLVKLIIAAFLIAFAITTVNAIIKGITGGIKIVRDMFSGVPVEEVMRKEQEEYKKRRETEKAKLMLRAYRITHPMEYFNSLLHDRLLVEIKKGKDNGKTIQ